MRLKIPEKRLFVLVLVLASGCISTESIDFTRYRDISLTAGAPQKKHIISDYFEVRGYGLNILGMVPVGVVSIDEALDELVELAKEAEVDGVGYIRIERLGPPFPWAFILWYKGVKISGFGFKYVKE